MTRIYTLADINVVEPLSFIRRHPEIFFGTEPPSAMAIAARICDEVRALGCEPVAAAQFDGATVVAAAKDWLLAGSLRYSVAEIFAAPVALPEIGANSNRSEVLAVAYCRNVVTCTPASVEAIKGTPDSLLPAIERLSTILPAWSRAVCFSEFES